MAFHSESAQADKFPFADYFTLFGIKLLPEAQ